MTTGALELDAVTALHLAAAIESHREQREKSGKDVPPGLADLKHAAIEAGTTGGNLVVVPRPGGVRLDPDTTRTRIDDDPDELLDHEAAGREAGVTSRTIRRWIDRGDVPAHGPRRRVRRADIVRHGIEGAGRPVAPDNGRAPAPTSRLAERTP